MEDRVSVFSLGPLLLPICGTGGPATSPTRLVAPLATRLGGQSCWPLSPLAFPPLPTPHSILDLPHPGPAGHSVPSSGRS